MSNPDINYFNKRFIEERAAAQSATDARAAEIHLDLARRYEAVVQAYQRPPLQSLSA